MPAYKTFRLTAEINAIQFTGHNLTDVTNFAQPGNFQLIEKPDEDGAIANVFSKELGEWIALYLNDWVVEEAGTLIVMPPEIFDSLSLEEIGQ